MFINIPVGGALEGLEESNKPHKHLVQEMVYEPLRGSRSSCPEIMFILYTHQCVSH